MKTVPTYLKKISDVVNKEVVKNSKFNTLKTNVDNIEKKIPLWNYFNSHKSIQPRQTRFKEKKLEILIKKIPDTIQKLRKLVKLRTKYQILVV